LTKTIEKSPSLPFGILDALVLVSAIVVAYGTCLGLNQAFWVLAEDVVSLPVGKPPDVTMRWSQNAAYFHNNPPSNSWFGIAAYWSQMAAFWSCPWLVTLGFAVASLTFIPPRPPFRQVMRYPGAIASVAFVAAFAAFVLAQPGTLIGPFFHFNSSFNPVQNWLINICFALPRTAALAVAISWLTLALTRRSLPDSRGLDRLGTAIGCCWIALGLIRVLASWLAALAG
jgi:hypothetical protein